MVRGGITICLEVVTLLPFALLWAFLPNDGVALVANWFFEKVETSRFFGDITAR